MSEDKSEFSSSNNTINNDTFLGTVVQAGGDVVFSSTAAPVALAQLPPLIRGFTGRDGELALMGTILDAATGADVLVSAVSGLPGIGKTTLAVHAAHAAHTRGHFAGGIIFIDMHGYDEAPVDPGYALGAMARALGVPEESIPPDAEARAALYRSRLAEIRDPVLVFIDNASSESQVRPLLPGPGPHRALVTSRHTLGGLDARLIDVTILEDLASTMLLDTALRDARPDDSRITADPDGAAQLAEICGGLPLALQIVAAILKSDPVRRAGELANELATERKRLDLLQYDDGNEGRALSVAAAFGMSCRLLNESSTQMFRLLALMPGPDISMGAAAALAGLPISEARGIMAGLVKAHLLDVVPGDAPRWRMHDLLRIYGQKVSGGTTSADFDRLCLDRLFSYYVVSTQAAAYQILAWRDVIQSDRFANREEALSWLSAERAALLAALGAAATSRRYQLAFDLSVCLFEYLSWRRYVDDWLTTAAVGVSAAQGLHDRAREAGALNNLGLALQGARRFDEAAAAHRSSAGMFREIGDEFRFGTAMHNLGMALEEMRQFDEAIAAYQDDLAICRRLNDRHGECGTMTSLSICLDRAGRLDEAVTTSRAAAEIYRALGDRRGEAMALNNLGGFLGRLGHLDEALTKSKESASLLRAVGDRYNEAMTLVTMAGIFFRAQRYEEGIAVSKDAAVIFRDIGDRHAEAGAVSNLAGNLLKAQRFDEAIAADEQAIAIFRETEDKHSEGSSLHNLGIALGEAGRENEAIPIHRDTVEIFRALGDRDREGDALSALSAALGARAEYDESIAVGQAAVTIFQQIENRRGEGLARINIGTSQRRSGGFDEAIASFEQALSIFRDLGDRSEEGRVLIQLGSTLGHVGRNEESIVASQSAMLIFRETGEETEEAQAFYNLAVGMMLTDRLDETVTISDGAYAKFRTFSRRDFEIPGVDIESPHKKEGPEAPER